MGFSPGTLSMASSDMNAACSGAPAANTAGTRWTVSLKLHILFYTEYRELQPTQSKHCSVNLERITEKFSYVCLHIPEKIVCRPEAVAGPTPFRELSSAMAACTSGRRVKAFLEHFSTSSSLLEATSCCSLGLNFPLCRQAHRATQGHIWWRECFNTLHAISKLYYVFEGVITGACGEMCETDALVKEASAKETYRSTQTFTHTHYGHKCHGDFGFLMITLNCCFPRI